MTNRRKPIETPQAVDAHGRITVPLGGADYVLCPAWEAIDMIEQQLGRSSMQLAGLAAAGMLTGGDMAVICCEMMKAQGKRDSAAGPSYSGAKPEKLARLIHEAGAPYIMARITVLMVGVVTGGYTAEGEAKPAA